MKKLTFSAILTFLLFSLFYMQTCEASKRRVKYGKFMKFMKRKDKKDVIATKRDNPINIISKTELRSLENKFETIKDLGSIFKCRSHSSETFIDGDHFICDGKRFRITPEAAKDIEMTGSTRQGIMQSPNGLPEDLFTIFHGGIYGQPVASFLSEPYGLKESGFHEPHDQYPMLGIYDHGLRSLDSKNAGRKKVIPMSINNNNKLMNEFDDDLTTGWQPRNIPSYNARNNDENLDLGEISQALQFDDNDVNDDIKQYDDYQEDNDNFFRDSRMQMDAFGMNGVNKVSNNPYAQYWKSLKTNFYGTTASQLGERDPSANSHEKIYEKGEMKTKIPIKKSDIQKNSGESDKKRSIPRRPEISSKLQDSTTKNQGRKRYMIYGGQQFPQQYYRSPSFNSMQYIIRHQRPFTRTFAPYNNYPFTHFREYRPNFNFASQHGSQQGFVRSFGMPYSQRWGYSANTQQVFDPYLEGRDSQQPLERDFAQVQSQVVAGEPGHPRVGVMQYGIQPNTKRPPFLGYVPVPIMQPVPMNFQPGGMSYEGTSYEPHSPEETLEQASDRSTLSTSSQNGDGSREYERLTDPQSYLPAPLYKPQSYNPHESEDFFPDGTNQKEKEDENEYLKGNDLNQSWQREAQSPNAAELYEDEMQEEQDENVEQARKRANQPETHLNIHGNKLDTGPDGKMMFTKDHVGFGPITVEAKTANSAMKDPTDDDK